MIKEMNERFQYVVYKLNGVTYVPHYKDTKFYVGPGFPKHNSAIYTADDMLRAGAVPHGAMLWKRAEYNARGLDGLK